jgi:hypothetical protein
MNALTACVNFHDYLAITLPRNRRFFERFTVVTDWDDRATRCMIEAERNKARHYLGLACTTAFYQKGCSFNRGAAISEVLQAEYGSTFSFVDQSVWVCLLDADIVIHPDFADAIENLQPGNIYMAKLRRQCDDPLTMAEYADQPALWDDLPVLPEMRLEKHGRDGGAGYCQIFHTSDPVLGAHPWYPTEWTHTGGSDTEFLEKWPPENRKRLDFEVLHLGKPETHWHGRTGRFLDGRKVPNSEEHARAMQEMWKARRKHGLKGERL